MWFVHANLETPLWMRLAIAFVLVLLIAGLMLMCAARGVAALDIDAGSFEEARKTQWFFDKVVEKIMHKDKDTNRMMYSGWLTAMVVIFGGAAFLYTTLILDAAGTL